MKVNIQRCVILFLVTGIIYVAADATMIGYSSAKAAQNNYEIIYDVAWHPNGQSLAISTDTGIWLYSNNLEVIAHLNLGGIAIAWNTTGTRLAATGTNIRIFNMEDLTLARTIERQSNSYATAWNPLNDLLAVANGATIQIWNTTDGTLFRELKANDAPIDSLDWHPDGIHLAASSAYDKMAHIWNIRDRFITLTLEHVNAPEAIVWHPTDNLLATADGNNINLWRADDGYLLNTLQGHTKQVLDLSWSESGLASVSRDRTVRVWDTNGHIIETFEATSFLTSATWSPDGLLLAYWGSNSELPQIVMVLESRCSPTNFVASSDVTGLISAINTANANPDADVIGLAAGTYTFTTVNNNRNALPRITTDITICSTDGATLTRSPSAPQFRFFEVRSTGNLTLENLTLTNSSLGVDYDGGAIFNLGTLTVNQVTFSNNQAGVGGAIASEDGQVTVTDSTFTGNASTGDGGAIHSEADLVVETSTFTGNTADDAGAVNNDGGTLTVTDSMFSDNSADDGGAIYNDAGTLTLSGSTFTNNSGDAGGALDNLDGQAQIDSSTFTGNSASDGGAIRNYGGTITLTTSRFTGNTATDDGGALNNSGGALTITDTYLENNSATTRGGAIYSNSSGTMSAHNSCISGNSATAVYSASTSLQDFTGNWWGAANGPGGAGPGSGDTVNSKIIHANFLTGGCPLP